MEEDNVEADPFFAEPGISFLPGNVKLYSCSSDSDFHPIKDHHPP